MSPPRRPLYLAQDQGDHVLRRAAAPPGGRVSIATLRPHVHLQTTKDGQVLEPFEWHGRRRGEKYWPMPPKDESETASTGRSAPPETSARRRPRATRAHVALARYAFNAAHVAHASTRVVSYVGGLFFILTTRTTQEGHEARARNFCQSRRRGRARVGRGALRRGRR